MEQEKSITGLFLVHYSVIKDHSLIIELIVITVKKNEKRSQSP